MIQVELSSEWVNQQLFAYATIYRGPVHREKFDAWLKERYSFPYLHVDNNWTYSVGVDTDEEAVLIKLKTSC